MPDTAVETPAAGAAAEQTPAPPAATETPASFDVPAAGTPEYAEWRQTGQVPAKKPAASAKEAKPSSKNAPTSDTGDTSREPRSKGKAAGRLEEILEDLKTAGLTPEELKTFRKEAQKSAQPPATTEKTDKPAETAPADNGRPKRPKPEDFETVDKYEEALDQYTEALTDWKLAQKDAERAAASAKQAMDQKLADARQRYGEQAGDSIKQAATAIFADKAIPGAVKALVDQSDVITDLLYVIGSKPGDMAELVNLAKSNPGQAIRKLVVLEGLVREELKKPAAAAPAAGAGKEGEGEGETPTRGTDGKFTAKTPDNKKPKETPAPPKEVGAGGTPPPEASERALKEHEAGDAEAFSRFRRARNDKDLSQRRGR